MENRNFLEQDEIMIVPIFNFQEENHTIAKNYCVARKNDLNFPVWQGKNNAPEKISLRGRTFLKSILIKNTTFLCVAGKTCVLFSVYQVKVVMISLCGKEMLVTFLCVAVIFCIFEVDKLTENVQLFPVWQGNVSNFSLYSKEKVSKMSMILRLAFKNTKIAINTLILLTFQPKSFVLSLATVLLKLGQYPTGGRREYIIYPFRGIYTLPTLGLTPPICLTSKPSKL